MDHKRALEILEIDVDTCAKIDLEMLKRQYHKLALRNHPDKNGNTLESNMKFQLINEAYEFVKKEVDYLNVDPETKATNKYEYTDYVNLFLHEIVNSKYTDLFVKIVKDIVISYKTKLSSHLFEGLDKEAALNVYTFLSKYQGLFHLSPETMNQVKEIVTNKFSNVNVYTVNPSLNDLFENKVYKLYVLGQLYLVPLWHNDLYFDSRVEEDKEIIVLCEPQLPPNVTIDEENNIYTELTLLSSNIFNGYPNIQLLLGNKVFEIPKSSLFMKSEQIYRIKKQGISKIKDDIYDVTDKADIIVKVRVNHGGTP
jgi:curved DNA-binding protein CbpA